MALAGHVPATCGPPVTSRPRPPPDAYYVDALAVAPGWRRRGHRPQRAARRAPHGRRDAPVCAGSRSTPACRTRGARALYEAYGFGEREIRAAPNDRTARALGGPGFVGYLKAV